MYMHSLLLNANYTKGLAKSAKFFTKERTEFYTEKKKVFMCTDGLLLTAKYTKVLAKSAKFV